MENSDVVKEETNSGRFSGRESRWQFLPKVVFALVSICLVAKCGDWIVRHAPPSIGNVIAFLIVSYALVLSVAMVPATVRRLHDLDLSGWWVLPFVIAQNVMRNIKLPLVMQAWGVVELGLYAYLCFWPGDKKANSYGLPVKDQSFSWVKWMAIVFAVPVIAEIAAVTWLKNHPVPEQEQEPACVQVFSPDEMARKVEALTGQGACAGFEAFRNETRGNSLTLTNLTVVLRGDLGGGMTELCCQLDREDKNSRLFVLVYFPSAQMDRLPRPFARNDRITAVTGTVVSNLDKYLHELKEYKGGLNAHPWCHNAI